MAANVKIFTITHLANAVKIIQNIFLVGYVLIVALFFVCGVGLIVLAAVETWSALHLAAELKVGSASSSSWNASAC